MPRTRKTTSSFPLLPNSGSVTTLTWSPDSRFLAAATDRGYLTIWEPKRRKVYTQERLSRSAITCLAWAPSNGVLLAGDSGGYIHRLAVTKRAQKGNTRLTSHLFEERVNGFTGAITRIQWSPSPLGRCLVVGEKMVALVSEQGEEHIVRYDTGIADVAWKSDRVYLVLTKDGLLDVRNAITREQQKQALPLAQTGENDSLCLLSHHGQVVIGTAQGQVLRMRENTPASHQLLFSFSQNVSSMQIRGGRLLVQTARAIALALWESEEQPRVIAHQTSQTPSPVASLDPQGNTIALVGPGVVTISPC